MQMRKIDILKDLHGVGVIGQEDTPQLSAYEMQLKVEEVARKVIIPTMNENAEVFERFAEDTELVQNGHNADNVRHITALERNAWTNTVELFDMHSCDALRHVALEERTVWNGAIISLNAHRANIVEHITGAERAAWNEKVDRTELNAKLGDISSALVAILGV